MDPDLSDEVRADGWAIRSDEVAELIDDVAPSPELAAAYARLANDGSDFHIALVTEFADAFPWDPVESLEDLLIYAVRASDPGDPEDVWAAELRAKLADRISDMPIGRLLAALAI
jgi:hypothetical protein